MQDPDPVHHFPRQDFYIRNSAVATILQKYCFFLLLYIFWAAQSVASRRATNLATHLPNLATHLYT
jgi:hypothetical protein